MVPAPLVKSTNARLAFFFASMSVLGFACGDDDAATDGGVTASGTGSASASGTVGATGSSSSSAGDGGAGGAGNKAAHCATEFGDALTSSFGRLDGTVLAVVKPTDKQCLMYNDDHVVLEVTSHGAVYRLVINVQSTTGDPMVRFLELDHAALPPAWSDGWHVGVSLDYIAQLGLHTTSPFMPYSLSDLSDRIADDITIGQNVSVYAVSSGGSSAHDIHRNHGGDDGAIVLDPDTAPKFLLFHFADQSF